MAHQTVSRRSVLQRGAALLGALPINNAWSPEGLTVHPSSDSTIQNAVDAANDGDTVVIAEGTYRERVEITKDLTLRGVGDVIIKPPTDTLSGSVLNPVLSARGAENRVQIEGLSIIGNTVKNTVFRTGIEYRGADGRIIDVSVTGLDAGIFVTRRQNGDGASTVTVRDCRFQDVGMQPLTFNESGTVGRVRDTVIIGTPGRPQYGLTAAFGAQVDARQNDFSRLFHDSGFGIGLLTYNSHGNMVVNNKFENVQYPAYIFSETSEALNETDMWSNFARNTIDSPDLKSHAESYGTMICGHGKNSRDETLVANRVEITENEYANLDTGISIFSVGEGVSQEIKRNKNRFTNVSTKTNESGKPLSTEPIRVE